MDLLTSFYIALGINIVMFIPAYLWKKDKLTDISYAVTFAVTAIIGLFMGKPTLPSKIPCRKSGSVIHFCTCLDSSRRVGNGAHLPRS